MINFEEKCKKHYRYTLDDCVLFDNSDGEQWDLSTYEDAVTVPDDVPARLLDIVAERQMGEGYDWETYMQFLFDEYEEQDD